MRVRTQVIMIRQVPIWFEGTPCDAVVSLHLKCKQDCPRHSVGGVACAHLTYTRCGHRF